MDEVNKSAILQPKKVTFAIYLIIASIGLNLIFKLLNRLVFEDSDYFTTGELILSIFIYLIEICFIFFLNKRQNWARILYAISVGIGFIKVIPFLSIKMHYALEMRYSTAIPDSSIEYNYTNVLNIQSIIGLIVGSVALMLLFSKESNKWFKLNKYPEQ